MLVNLISEKGTYKDKKTNEEKRFINFYVECGAVRVPVEVKYFGTDEKADKGYSGRKAILEAFANPLPEKVVTSEASQNTVAPAQ